MMWAHGGGVTSNSFVPFQAGRAAMIVGAIALTVLSIYAFTIKVPDHSGGLGKSMPVPNDPPSGQSAAT